MYTHTHTHTHTLTKESIADEHKHKWTVEVKAKCTQFSKGEMFQSSIQNEPQRTNKNKVHCSAEGIGTILTLMDGWKKG